MQIGFCHGVFVHWKKRLIKIITSPSYRQFILDTQKPQAARDRLWHQEILPLLKKGSFWREHLSGDNCPILEDFEITTYADYENVFTESTNHLIQPLNGEEIIYWGETSGSTGKRKFFPLTASVTKQYPRIFLPYLHALNEEFSHLYVNKILSLTCMDPSEKTPAGISIGMVSNFTHHRHPEIFKQFFAVPEGLYVNVETFKEWAPLYALASDLSAIFAVTPMVIEEFYHLCADRIYDYMPYLTKTKKLPGTLPPLNISKQRIDYLRHLKRCSYEVLWPSLQFVACWKSGPCELPANELAKFLGHIENIEVTYSSTEGTMTVPFRDIPTGSVFHPGASIVEFIEVGQPLHKLNLRQSWELVPKQHYEVFITNSMGIVRYRIKDVVKCKGFYNQAPILEFCYKSEGLKLEYCTIAEPELRQMLKKLDFELGDRWCFARNQSGDRVLLVVDEKTTIANEITQKMHEILIEISETYAHSVKVGETLPLTAIQVPFNRLLQNVHAQSKPLLITREVF